VGTINTDQLLQFLQHYDIAAAVVIILISIAAAVIAKYMIKLVAWQLAKKTQTNLDDEILHALETPVLIGIILVGIFIASFTIQSLVPYHDLSLDPEQYPQRDLLFKIVFIVTILWVTLTGMRLIKAIFRWYEHEIAAKTASDFDDKYLHIIRRVINIFILVMAVLVMLNHLGIEITPLLAGLGIGGLAVALALQDSLGNFFAGFYTMTERAIKIGDYIETDGGVKGYVKDINWRTTKVQSLDNNLIILPNSKLSQATVTNYDSPNSTYTLAVPVGVSYDADLDKVEKVCIKVGTKVLTQLKELPKDQPPLVRYNQFADSSINFNVLLRIKNYANRFPVRHEFMKALKKEFDREKIEIPYPQRVIHTKK
jgi:small-conductance mechanosensitive channel